MAGNPKTPDCGPHCKVKTRVVLDLRTIRIDHCKCKQCHGKPVRRR